MRLAAAAAVLAAFFSAPATAASYTYDVSYSFPILRDAGLGAHASPRAGRGSVSGTFTIADDFFSTGTILDFDLVAVNTATGFTALNSYSFSSSDAGDTSSYTAPASVWDPAFRLNFRDDASAASCSENLIAPTGQHAGRHYQISASTMTLYIARSFTPGDASFSMIGSQIFGRAPLCGGQGYADLGYEHTAPGNAFVLAGTLSTGGGENTPAVPVPAALPLLGCALAVFGLVSRRRRA